MRAREHLDPFHLVTMTFSRSSGSCHSLGRWGKNPLWAELGSDDINSHIPLARTQSHGHTLLQVGAGDIVSLCAQKESIDIVDTSWPSEVVGSGLPSSSL